MSSELIAWLRKQVEADLSAARIVGAGGYEPQRWDTEPPGQVNPAAIPATAQINAALLPDPEDREFRECACSPPATVTATDTGKSGVRRYSRQRGLPGERRG